MTWNKAQPAGTTKVRDSDNYIRDNWAWLEETFDDEHGFPTDGKHTDITCRSLQVRPIAAPTAVSDRGTVYGKDIDDKIELMYLDEDDNEIQLTTGGLVGSEFAAGTKIPFYQNAAPTGWTLVSGIEDRLISVKGGSTYLVGGAVYGSWTLPVHTLDVSEIPSHNHGGNSGYYNTSHTHTFGGATPKYGTSGSDGSYGDKLYGGTYTSYSSVTINSGGSNHRHSISSQGGGGSHDHGNTYRPKSAVCIICSKDA